MHGSLISLPLALMHGPLISLPRTLMHGLKRGRGDLSHQVIGLLNLGTQATPGLSPDAGCSHRV